MRRILRKIRAIGIFEQSKPKHQQFTCIIVLKSGSDVTPVYQNKGTQSGKVSINRRNEKKLKSTRQ